MTKKKTPTVSGRTAAKLKAKQAQKQEKVRQPMIQAMVWYKEEEYDGLRQIFDDGDLLPPTYREWLKLAEEKKEEAETAGDQVVKVFIDPETFPQWCEKKNLSKDANARSELAIEVVRLQAFQL